MQYPTLYGHVSKGDKIKIWNIYVVEDKETKHAKIVRTYGQQNGKQAESVKEITKGKNIGRSNETTPYVQACNEAQSLWNKQIEAGYVKSIDQLEKSTTLLPMLAHDYCKRGKDIVLESAYIQPKIDGVRLLVKDDLSMISRTGKPITILSHLVPELTTLYSYLGNDVMIDGEIFTFDLPFEEISGLFRQTKNVNKSKIQQLKYYIFDIINNDPFAQRIALLQKCFAKCKFKHLVLVNTAKLTTSFDEAHQQCVLDGYEGIMLRNANGLYKSNFRSVDLQKYKKFVDDEYVITAVNEATGNDKGTAVFVCKDNKSNEEFCVRPRGSRTLRTEYLQNSKHYIGKKLTVRYQNLTENGLPRFPVGITVRDYE